MSKREKLALALAVTGIIWWFAENFYFGWNAKPTTPLEGIADFMVWVFWVLAYFIRPTNMKIENQTINTKNVIINGDVRGKFRENKEGK